MKQNIVLLLAVGTCFLIGCKKQTSSTTTNSAQVATLPDSVTDWGVLAFSENTPQHLKLKDGRDCTLTAVSLTDGKFQVTIKTKTKASVGNSPSFVSAGKVAEITETIRFPSSRTFYGYVDDQLVKFTAKLNIL